MREREREEKNLGVANENSAINHKRERGERERGRRQLMIEIKSKDCNFIRLLYVLPHPDIEAIFSLPKSFSFLPVWLGSSPAIINIRYAFN